jgi:hypothetical protein
MSQWQWWQELSRLLHDARVRHLEWDEPLGRVSVVLDCLRREVDGAEMEDAAVELLLEGVRAAAVGYESGIDGVRPSDCKLSRTVTPDDLRDWPYAPQEAYVTVNSAACEDDALNAPRSDRLLGNPEMLLGCPTRLGLRFDHTAMLGAPTNTIALLFGGDRLGVFSGGAPLDLETWQDQYNAWWQGWRRYWSAKRGGDAGGATGRREECLIPAAAPAPPNRSYRPPAEPPAEWEPTDAPADLLQPIADWFEGSHQGDWLRIARAFPNLDWTPERRAEELERRSEQDFGRWGYARQVDWWWAEGNHAQVAVRGVEHSMPADDDLGGNEESVWTFRIRRRGGSWSIRTYALGWPRFGSRPVQAETEKSWLRRWSSGAVQSKARRPPDAVSGGRR